MPRRQRSGYRSLTCPTGQLAPRSIGEAPYTKCVLWLWATGKSNVARCQIGCRADNDLDTGLLRARLGSWHPGLLGKLLIRNACCGSGRRANPMSHAVRSDAAQTTIWIPVSYVPDWAVGTQVYWGSSLYEMRVVALGDGQIQCRTLSGYFGWGPGNLITQTLTYTMPGVVTAAINWTTPGVGNTVVVSATAISASVGDVVWVGGVGADQFRSEEHTSELQSLRH